MKPAPENIIVDMKINDPHGPDGTSRRDTQIRWYTVALDNIRGLLETTQGSLLRMRPVQRTSLLIVTLISYAQG